MEKGKKKGFNENYSRRNGEFPFLRALPEDIKHFPSSARIYRRGTSANASSAGKMSPG